MLESLPNYISIVFVLTAVATLILFWLVVKKSTSARTALAIFTGLVIWLFFQALLSVNGVYKSNLLSIPPKILLFGVMPGLLLIIAVFMTKHGRDFIDRLPLRALVLLNVVRVPVELVLFWLFLHQAVPKLMTFEGRNFDIIAGLTAPLMAYFGFKGGVVRRKAILAWNFICLALLLNIVINALFSAPWPLQKFAFDQPNIAIFYFPFSWLPTFIVPIVLFGHLASIRQLINSKPAHYKTKTG